jgi:hypothetical protein
MEGIAKKQSREIALVKHGAATFQLGRVSG